MCDNTEENKIKKQKYRRGNRMPIASACKVKLVPGGDLHEHGGNHSAQLHHTLPKKKNRTRIFFTKEYGAYELPNSALEDDEQKE